MPTQEQRKPMQPGKLARWWLALMGVVLFSITVAPDYALLHVVFGVFIVVAIHLAVAVFKRNEAPLPSSNTPTLLLLLPLAAVGVLGILFGESSVWHAYFCALAIGSFTAMCWFFPNRPTTKNTPAAPEAPQI